jgi:hypothetical protein
MAESLGLTSLGSYEPKLRFAGSTQPEEKKVVLLSGEGVLEDLAVLGKVLMALGTPAAGGTNTGNGTLSGVALSSKTKLGDYKITMTAATKFIVEDPDGLRLPDGETGAAYASTGINFQLDAGGTAFVAGDTFTIPVEEPESERYRLSKTANVDGSQYPDCVLGEGKDASSEDVVSFAYIKGAFPDDEITLGTGHTLAKVKEVFEKKSIFLHPTYK